jgi:carbon-monoxide dehydrogenase large subunit
MFLPLYPPAFARPVLADGVVRYVGEQVAVVVAETMRQAVDAAEAVVVDYDALPAVVDLEDAAADQTVIHQDLGTNKSYTWELTPDPAAVEAAFASAAHTVSGRYVQQRLLPSPMETRGVLVVPQPFGGDFTLYSATQIPHILRVMLALTVGVPETSLRVVAPSVGGGFGCKLNVCRGSARPRAGSQAPQADPLDRRAKRAFAVDHPGAWADPAHRRGR